MSTDEVDRNGEVGEPTWTNEQMIFAELAAKFARDDVKTRKGSGKDLPYVTARTVMNRLDDVLGPDKWWDEYHPFGNGIICRLTIVLPDGRHITKEDVGGQSKTNDPSDEEKTAFSDAFKRAAVKFGVGRYLYGDRVPMFVRNYHAAKSACAEGHRGD